MEILLLGIADFYTGKYWVRYLLVAWWHQATNDDFSQVMFCGIHLTAISQWVPNLIFCILTNLRINILELLPKSPRGQIFNSQGTLAHAQSRCRQTRREAGEKFASTQIISCVHTYAAAECRWSRGKIRSATNGFNTQVSSSASKSHTPKPLTDMADPLKALGHPSAYALTSLR